MERQTLSYVPHADPGPSDMSDPMPDQATNVATAAIVVDHQHHVLGVDELPTQLACLVRETPLGAAAPTGLFRHRGMELCIDDVLAAMWTVAQPLHGLRWAAASASEASWLTQSVLVDLWRIWHDFESALPEPCAIAVL